MVFLIAAAKPLQNLDRLRLRRLIHHNRLKPAFQGRIFFDVFAVFFQRRRTNELNLAPRQRRFQDIGGIDRALRAACTDDRVNLINKQEHISTLPHLGKYLLNPLFELTAILGSCDHAGQIEADNPLFRDRLRYIAGNNELCQTFHNRRLSDAWFPDQARIILRPAA